MRNIQFTSTSFQQYNDWLTNNKQIYNKLNKLIIEIARNPFEGSGNPESLKHDLKGYWSRRITDEHRLVYIVEEELIIIIACKFHYKFIS